MSAPASDPLIARLRRVGEARMSAAGEVAVQAGEARVGAAARGGLEPTLARLIASREGQAAAQRPARDWLAVAVPAGLAATLVSAALLPPSPADKLLAPSVGAGAEALARLFERLGDPTR